MSKDYLYRVRKTEVIKETPKDSKIGICMCWHYRAKYVGNDNDWYFLVLILLKNRSHMGLSLGYTLLYSKIPTNVYYPRE